MQTDFFRLIAVAAVLASALVGACTEEPAEPMTASDRGSTAPVTESAPGPVPPEAVDSPATAADAIRRVSNGGRYRVTFTTEPSPLPLNEMFRLRAQVEQRMPGSDAWTAAEGIELAVDAAMPAHHHGMNVQPRVTEAEDGSYSVRGLLFHMPGDWSLYFDITKDGVTERAQYDIELE